MGILDCLVADAHSEPGIGNAALLRYATIPAPCYRAARAEGVKAQIELPFAALHEAGENAGPAGVAARSQCDVLVAAFGPAAGQRQIVLWQGLAVLDLPSEVAADQPPLCASSADVEITLLCGYLQAD